MIDIIYEDNHLLVVNKPINIPVQADSSKDQDLLTLLKKQLKEKYQKPGNVYLGLVHRLDRPVGGIMVFAKTSKAASRLSEQIRNSTLKKTYLAVVQGKVLNSDTFKDKLEKDQKTNIVKISPIGKQAELSYELLEYKDNLSLVKINLKTGRSHQIRVQFSSRNHPLYGDQKYNPNTPKDQIALFAHRLEFIHPTTKEVVKFELPKPNRYPFNIFN
ncbi:MAG: RluA family pseudouridine synthase [Bacilli bacterium]